MNGNSSISDAAEDGRHAAERGEPLTNNPHSANSDAHREWAEGHASHERPEDVADDLADFA